MEKIVEERLVSRACSARKIALDRGATEFEAMRFALEAMDKDQLPFEYWLLTRGTK